MTAPAESLAAAPAGRQRSWLAGPALRRFRRNPLALAGAASVLLMVVLCAIGPHLLPYTDTFIDLRARFSPPVSGPHILGTDQMGRDMLARLLMAGRISL